jgi:hypothetical protein
VARPFRYLHLVLKSDGIQPFPHLPGRGRVGLSFPLERPLCGRNRTQAVCPLTRKRKHPSPSIAFEYPRRGSRTPTHLGNSGHREHASRSTQARPPAYRPCDGWARRVTGFPETRHSGQWPLLMPRVGGTAECGKGVRMWHCEFPDLRLQGHHRHFAAVVGSIMQTFHARKHRTHRSHRRSPPPRESGSPLNARQAGHSRHP